MTLKSSTSSSLLKTSRIKHIPDLKFEKINGNSDRIFRKKNTKGYLNKRTTTILKTIWFKKIKTIEQKCFLVFLSVLNRINKESK